ncbi:transcription factor S [Thermosphaera chiliense]|uniref:Transcription factor S n=1 Tax=Thermosphaera chiliense TaxID=3402707 RepID=A0A7M1UU23_9CREN|nr:transcription factor S [Thermosphaera aggregans]QOR94414.1 transcription factor S [Thermosphaera aggregans]
MVRFCPKCGGLMKPVKSSKTTELVCVKCGYRMKAGERELEKYKVSSKIEHSTREKTIVVGDVDTSKLPVTKEATCPKCGNHEAYYWMIQTRAADEPPTRFYKCVKCGHTWREYE